MNDYDPDIYQNYYRYYPSIVSTVSIQFKFIISFLYAIENNFPEEFKNVVNQLQNGYEGNTTKQSKSATNGR